MGKRKLYFGLLLPLFAGLAVSGLKGANSPKTVKAEGSPWAFDTKFDQMIDDFYHDDVNRTLTGGAIDVGFSYVTLRTNHPSASADNAMYKYSSGLEKKNASIFFEALIDTNVELDKVFFNVRGGGVGTSDSWSDKNVPLTETVDNDGGLNDALLRDSWITLSISIPNTFSDAVYPTGTVSDSALGFSLFGDATNLGSIKLRRVSVDSTVIDDFNRLPEKAPEGAYWAGIDGTLTRRSVIVSGGGSYEYVVSEPISKNNVVLSLKGDLSDATILTTAQPEDAGTPVSFSDAVDRFGADLPTEVSEFTNVDINLSGSGLTEDFRKLVISSTAQLEINTVFATDGFNRQPETLFPGLDLGSASFINDFNFTAEGPYTEGYNAAPEVFVEHGINFIAPWHNSQGVKFDGEHMVLPALSEPGYASFFLGARDPIVKDYLVVQAKAEDTDFSALRFNFFGTQTEALWMHEANAGFGLKTLAHPYVDNEGYTWLIISVENNEKLDRASLNGEITVYFGHTEGEIKITNMFYADRAEIGYDFVVVDDAEVGDADYQYVGYIEAGVRYLELTYKGGVGGGRLSTFRLEQANVGTRWLKDGDLIGQNGEVLLNRELAEGEEVTLVIDLLASGFDITVSEHYHSHFGGYDDVTRGVLIRTNVSVQVPSVQKTELMSAPLVLATAAAGTGYQYGGGYDIGPIVQVGETLVITLSSETAIAGGLDGVRIAIGGKTLWFVDNPEGQLRDKDGALFSTDIAAGDNVFSVNLPKSGVDPNAIANGPLHVHITNGTASDISLTLKSLVMERALEAIDFDGLVYPDYVKPTIVEVLASASEYYVGETVTISVTATDNKTPAEELAIELKVTFGSGETYKEIEVTGLSFVAEKAGTYSVTAIVTDADGNRSEKTIEVLVLSNHPGTSEPGTSEPVEPGTSTGEVSEPGTSEPATEEPKGLSPVATTLIVIGSVALVGAAGFAIWKFFIKKP